MLTVNKNFNVKGIRGKNIVLLRSVFLLFFNLDCFDDIRLCFC